MVNDEFWDVLWFHKRIHRTKDVYSPLYCTILQDIRESTKHLCSSPAKSRIGFIITDYIGNHPSLECKKVVLYKNIYLYSPFKLGSNGCYSVSLKTNGSNEENNRKYTIDFVTFWTIDYLIHLYVRVTLKKRQVDGSNYVLLMRGKTNDINIS